jgi:hypothetical protein
MVLRGLFTPAILFFAVGIATVLVKSDLTIPPEMSVAMAIFLMMAIGLKGGVEGIKALTVAPELFGVVIAVALFAMLCGPFFAIATAKVLKRFAKLTTADAWAAGGHYGAVSAVTLAVGVALAVAAQEAAPGELVFVGWMPAMYPFMDSSALIAAIVFGRMALAREGLGAGVNVDVKRLLHMSISGMAVWLLGSSLVVGALAQTFSPDEVAKSMRFFHDMFRGVLSLFLLDMGMAAGRQLGALRKFRAGIFRVVAVAYTLPLVWGVVGILGIYGLNLAKPGLLGWGDAFVFATIAGGCSYVTAPVAMRASIPEANPSVYLPMSIALTFPFNIVVSIPIWMIICMTLWRA